MTALLGYTVSHEKSTLMPTQRLVHLGYGVDNAIGAFFITDRHRQKFRVARDRLLSSRRATLHDMQSFVGKCNHLRLIFPPVSLFTFECRAIIPSLGEESQPLPQQVLDEISFWTFFDSITEVFPFRHQQHVGMSLHTDASGFAWGAHVESPSGPVVLRDYWTANFICGDICVKEALAVLLALSSVVFNARNRRVDVFSDNQGLVQAWAGMRSASRHLVGVLQSLFLLCCEFNISLKLHWVPSADNR